MRLQSWLVALSMLVGACDEESTPPESAPIADGGNLPSADASALEDAQVDANVARDASLPDASLDASSPEAGLDAQVVDAGPALDAAQTSSNCPALPKRDVIDVPAGILPSSLLHWSCDHIYKLTGIVVVHSDDVTRPQILSIDPGTLVMGSSSAESRGFLVVTRTGRIQALGTAHDPIVFTSDKPAGERARSDWGGLTLLGTAYKPAAKGVEGFPLTAPGVSNLPQLLEWGPFPSDADAGVSSDTDAHDCGTLRYVRVEFASYNAGNAGNESNGIQLYGCGYGTSIDYVQVHKSGDDGIELFGGATDLRHIVITGASDDGLDWDVGYRGRAQFVVIQQHTDEGDLGFEAGGAAEDPALAPAPRMFNLTFIGMNGQGGGKLGGRLRGGSQGSLKNALFVGFNAGALDIAGGLAAANFRSGALTVRNSVFYQAAAPTLFPKEADDVKDDDLDEEIELKAAMHQNRELDPKLEAPFDTLAPRLVPALDSPLGSELAAVPSEAPDERRAAFFDKTAQYVGAFAPGRADWTMPWAAYPQN